MHPVMLAKKYEAKRAKWPMWGSTKLDGIRGFKVEEGGFVSRNMKPIRGLDHLIEPFKGLHLGFEIDGELMIPGMHFQKASGLIRNHQQQPSVHFNVFDCTDPTKGFEERQIMLRAFIESLGHPQIHFLPHTTIKDEAHAAEVFAERLKEGHEGLMLKSRGHMYRNARSWDWMKMKVQDTADLICTRFFEGEGRLTGTLGGIVVDYNGVEVRIGTGFSDFERGRIWCNQEDYMNEIAEVAWHEETPGGSLRHPSFKGWRFDK